MKKLTFILLLLASFPMLSTAAEPKAPKPEQRKLSVSKVSKADLQSKNSTFQRVFSHVQRQEAFTKKGELVSSPFSYWRISAIEQRISPKKFVVKAILVRSDYLEFEKDGSFVLETKEEKKWKNNDRPPREEFATRRNDYEHVQGLLIEKYTESTLEEMGYSPFTQEKFIAMLKEGRTWKIEVWKKSLSEKKPRLTIWTIQWE